MNSYTLAVLADVHANRWALEAVLEDVEKRRVDELINLGDLLYGPLDPAGTYELIWRSPLRHIAGNMDRYVVEATTANASPTIPLSNPTMRFVVEELGSAAAAWLAQLPPTAAIGSDVLLCHGTPVADDTPLLERITAAGVEVKKDAELEAELLAVSAPIILCAHTHVPRHRQLPNGRQLINPGSVGLPAYADEAPFPHKMEAGSPHARYCLVTLNETGLQAIEQVALRYDWEQAARQAERLDRPDWAASLRTGRA